jgi:tryptophanyl-tRNA synthetase
MRGVLFTDPTGINKSDPGNPDICNVFSFHKVYSSPETVSLVDRECRAATLGCVEDKRQLAETLVSYLAPIQEVRARYLKDPRLVEEILENGCQRARRVAAQTMEEVRAAMKI